MSVFGASIIAPNHIQEMYNYYHNQGYIVNVATLHQPKLAAALSALANADAFYFFGHGGGSGNLVIDQDEAIVLGAEEIREVMAQRKQKNFDFVWLDACGSTDSDSPWITDSNTWRGYEGDHTLGEIYQGDGYASGGR